MYDPHIHHESILTVVSNILLHETSMIWVTCNLLFLFMQTIVIIQSLLESN